MMEGAQGKRPHSPRLKEEAEIPEALERFDLSYKEIVEWSPKMARDGPKRAQDGPKSAQAQDGAKMGPKGSKMGLRWPNIRN